MIYNSQIMGQGHPIVLRAAVWTTCVFTSSRHSPFLGATNSSLENLATWVGISRISSLIFGPGLGICEHRNPPSHQGDPYTIVLKQYIWRIKR